MNEKKLLLFYALWKKYYVDIQILKVTHVFISDTFSDRASPFKTKVNVATTWQYCCYSMCVCVRRSCKAASTNSVILKVSAMLMATPIQSFIPNNISDCIKLTVYISYLYCFKNSEFNLSFLKRKTIKRNYSSI